MACRTLKLLREPEYASRQSQLGRRQVEQMYNLENTYGKLMNEMCQWLEARQSEKR